MKKNKQTKNEIRQKINKHSGFFRSIKKIININILNGISEDEMKKNDPVGWLQCYGIIAHP